ncbi:3-deoxy-D-manno-octulosonic acid transferase [Caenimonas soli]|uniref:3-deoxy-D-manno-octulosonic acid transferase n=1 Tax=Caenimonas soli TaxID=2735555 RepID=UPI00155748DB|nr:3-deoxy-D-manno-octulosonic acid transferase [Caenimonas soli]NPC57267.1 3-deoxy-D-manno-octulosonic acid transferase [Caenimonas soli]
MIRSLYSLLASGAQLFLRRKLRRRGVAEPGYLLAMEERFGRYADTAQPGALWIHAVSLGETRAAAILIERLRGFEPGLRILLTHGTATGRAEGERLLRGGDRQAWLPWDTPKAVRRFLNHFQPSAGVLMETEVWPNLVAAAKARELPLVLANARLSEKSLSKARRLSRLSRPAYASLTAVWAQTEADAQRLAQAGATVKGVFGNLKFDAPVDVGQVEQGRNWRVESARPVVMFASSREGEEADFFRVLKANREVAQAGWARRSTDLIEPHVQWLVVPRHPQRFDEVAALAQQHGMTVSRRSQWTAQPEAADVWIGDSLGEMALYYGLADVALLGGSFAPLGGQNLIEAAACGCPVVMGPHTFNFAEAAQLAQEAGAALRVMSMEEAVRNAVTLAGNVMRRGAAVQAATAFCAAHQGAATKTAEAVLALLAR